MPKVIEVMTTRIEARFIVQDGAFRATVLVRMKAEAGRVRESATCLRKSSVLRAQRQMRRRATRP